MKDRRETTWKRHSPFEKPCSERLNSFSAFYPIVANPFPPSCRSGGQQGPQRQPRYYASRRNLPLYSPPVNLFDCRPCALRATFEAFLRKYIYINIAGRTNALNYQMKPKPAKRNECSQEEDRKLDAILVEHEDTIKNVVSWPKWSFTPEIRDEVVQQVRIEMARCADDILKADNIPAFVKRISVRRCIDEVRRQFRHRSHFEPIAVETGHDGSWTDRDFPAGKEWNPVHAIVQVEQARMLGSLLMQLDPTCQTAIDCFYRKQLSYREIADELRLAVNTVGARLNKCLAKLRLLVKKSGEDGEDLRTRGD